jgi:two-component system LytT family response regulator
VADIRALIVDDEPLARRGIRQMLAAHPDVEVVGECRDGKEAVRSLAGLRPDLVFLDIEMPGLDGLSALRILGPEKAPLVVFVTAHDRFAVEAFETRALDYLVKPLSEARFRDTMARVRERLRETRGGGHRLAIATPGGELLLDVDEIDWIEAQDDHAVIHAGSASHRLRATLGDLETRLPPGRFARVHRSAIVRRDAVRALRGGRARSDAVLVMRDGSEIRVSRRRLASVRRDLAGPGTDRSPRARRRSPRRD